MDKRFFTFLILAMAIMFGSQMLMQWWFPRPPKPVAQQNAADKDKKPGEKKADDKKPEDKKLGAPGEVAPGVKPDPAAPAAAPVAPAAEQLQPQQWALLGSLDDESPYRMLVTFNNLGAAVERVELNNPRYHEVDNIHPSGGYLGNLSVETYVEQKEGKPVGVGCRVNVVGVGTPAEAAGIKVGDVVTSVIDLPTTDVIAFERALVQTKPGSKVKIGLLREGKSQTVDVELRRHPLQLIRPEYTDTKDKGRADPLSFLLTLQQVGDLELGLEDTELAGVDLRTARWELLPKDASKPDEVAFRRAVPGKNVEVTKRYTLERRDVNSKEDTAQAYTLNMRIELKNTAQEGRKLAYRLDGPTGLPVEGFWYSKDSKIGLVDGCGVRDVVFGTFNGKYVENGMFICTSIVDKTFTHLTDRPVKYVGVDALYFTAVVLPKLDDPNENRFPRLVPIQVGTTPEKASFKKTTDVSFRLTSAASDTAPNAIVAHDFKVYLGPKVPELMAANGLDAQIDYGWFDWVAVPMLFLLHTFYGWVGNYGIAIIMLTVVVRSMMFPISRKQALNAIKMQELQPEIKKLTEKYKGKREELAKAQQDLFRKHNYNPFAGCLPVFMQLPIFVGLYNSLKVDVELRQAPLISENIRWASNLAAPDMFWYWEPYLPVMFGGEEGWLGPFLNLLPLATIALFLIQQKMFMPPATDEQTMMQQKMIKYMMFFMGFMFFKVPAGLCVYFITSSVWSICERKLLPKAKPAPIADATLNVEVAKPTENGKKSKKR
ncbi:MAG: YidC/Oxa1 family insertase periplasmic-domain containing protein [Planctomycetia bacterium]|nr:YidC/Oxa1 family insertase periplasmic-domain containing protein [Planctomycetia bacterium]